MLIVLSICSIVFAYESKLYSVDLSNNFVQQSNELGEQFNSINHEGASVVFRATSMDYLGNSYFSEIYNESYLNQLSEAMIPNIEAGNICSNTIILNKEITTYSKYQCFYIELSTLIYNTTPMYIHEYVIFSDNNMYEIMISSLNQNYIDSLEVQKIESTFNIKDSISFKSTPEIDVSDGVLTYHLGQYIDYFIIYVLFVIVAVILAVLIRKHCKVKYSAIIIIFFILQLMSIFGATMNERIHYNSFNLFDIAGFIGYFILAEISTILLIIQLIKTKK